MEVEMQPSMTRTDRSPEPMRYFDYLELFRSDLAGKLDSYDAFQLIRHTVRAMQSRAAGAGPDARLVSQFYEVQNGFCTGSVFFLVHWPSIDRGYPNRDDREAAYKACQACEILDWFPIDAGEARTPTSHDFKALAEGPWGAPPYMPSEQVRLYFIEVSSEFSGVNISAFQGIQGNSRGPSGARTADEEAMVIIFGGLRVYERDAAGKPTLVAIQWTRPPHDTGLDTMVSRVKSSYREMPPTIATVHKAAGFFDLV